MRIAFEICLLRVSSTRATSPRVYETEGGGAARLFILTQVERIHESDWTTVKIHKRDLTKSE